MGSSEDIGTESDPGEFSGGQRTLSVDADRARHCVSRELGEEEFGLHSRWFDLMVAKDTKRPFFGSPHIEFRNLQHVLGNIWERGAQIAVRTRAESEEMMKLVTRPGDTGASLLWRVANSDCQSRFEIYREHYGAEPESLADLHLSVEYLRHGFDYQSPTRALGRFAKRKLEVPRETGHYETEAAFALIEGVAIARAYPDFVTESDRVSSGYVDGDVEAYTASMEEHYEWAKYWATLNRPDLLRLFT